MIAGLGLRLAVAGGRESLLRLAVMTAGVGVGVMVLLLGLTAPSALLGRAERSGWQGADATTRATAADAALFLSVRDYHDAAPMTRAYVAALGARPPIPPGLQRLPAPGELAVSPALGRLLEATPDDQLDDRYPGRVVATIGEAGLAHPDELVGIIGRTPDQLEDVRSRELYTVRGFDTRPVYYASVLSSVFLVSALLLLAPVIVLIVMATRVAAAQREQRLAAIRLAGATRLQAAAVAAVETGVAAAAGCAVGWAAYEVARRAVAATVVFDGGRFFPDDLAVAPPLLAGVLIGMTLLTMAITAGATSRAPAGPPALAKRARRRPPSAWWALLPVIGIGCQFALVPLRDTLGEDVRAGLLVLSALATIIGMVAVGPWLCLLAGRALAHAGSGTAGLIAAKRIVADPRAAFRAAAGVMLAVAALTSAASTIEAPAALPRPELAPGVVEIYTGGVPEASIAPLLTEDAEVTRESKHGRGEVSTVFVRTDGTPAAENRVRTQAANLVPNALIHTRHDPKRTDVAIFANPAALLWRAGWYLVLIAAVCGLVVATVAGVLERRRPFALLRASGLRLGELYRVTLLETVVALLATALLGAGVGLGSSLATARLADVPWRFPDWDVLGMIGGGVLVALVLATAALPLLSAVTRVETVRYE